jgi:putative oxidoreductase
MATGGLLGTFWRPEPKTDAEPEADAESEVGAEPQSPVAEPESGNTPESVDQEAR